MDTTENILEPTRLAQQRRWLSWVFVLWALLAAVSSVKNVVQPVKRTVYPYFSNAARHWWSDLDLYGHYDGFDPYRYSPTFAVAMTPFGLVPDEVGGVIWIVLSVGLLLFAVRALAHEVLPGEWPPGREALLLGLTLVGTVRGIWSAQCNSLIVALVIFGMIAALRGRWWRAALLLSLPIFIKIWPVVICVLLILRWPKQLVWRLAVVTTGLALAPFLTRPWPVVWSQYATWYITLTGPLQARWVGYRDAWTIWEELAPPVDAHVYRVLQIVTLACLVLWCFWLSRRESSSPAYLAWTLAGWTGWQLFFGPGTERLTYGLAAPAIAWAVVVSFQEGRLRWLSVVAYLCTYIFGTGEVERALLHVFPDAKIVPPLGVALFLTWIAAWQWTALREKPLVIDVDSTPVSQHQPSSAAA